MPRFDHHLQYLTRDPVGALNGLIGIGIGTNRNSINLIARLSQSRAQQLCRIWLGKQPRLKIQPRRKVMIRMARPRIAIDAAMFTTAIGIY